ncbi:MAG: hypothetical protein M4D80_19165 [Myxococcota bacterium]|nr:hypothetical protein [Myxococcota bacterium]
MKFGLLLFLAAVVAGCTTKANPASCVDDHCNDPARPFCDEDGSVGGKPDTCIAVECMAGAFEACRGDNALTCNAAGTNYEEVECMYGCSDPAGGCNACNTSECEKHIIPRYLSNICNELSDRAPVSLTMQGLNTSVDENCSVIVSQAGAPEICVYRASAITVPANNTLRLVGSRAMALVADRDIIIDGIVDASGGTAYDGPGGDFTRSGGSMGGAAAGGAGFRHAGGSGGSTTADGGAANGGVVVPNPMGSAVLVAGRSGGHNAIAGYSSGGGGGGVTIISCRGTVKVAGIIDVNGGGGASPTEVPFSVPPMLNPATGGGSGGYVVLQGMNVQVSGQMFANGGAGGSGQAGGGLGQAGQRSVAVAQGATPSAGKAGTGGNGGTGPTAPTAGTKPIMLTTTDLPAAGGGSAGFLQIYAPSGGMLQLTPTTASPMLEGYLTLPTNR